MTKQNSFLEVSNLISTIMIIVCSIIVRKWSFSVMTRNISTHLVFLNLWPLITIQWCFFIEVWNAISHLIDRYIYHIIYLDWPHFKMKLEIANDISHAPIIIESQISLIVNWFLIHSAVSFPRDRRHILPSILKHQDDLLARKLLLY